MRVIYFLTTDRQTVNYYSIIHALEIIYFDSNTQETMKKQLYPSDFLPLHGRNPAKSHVSVESSSLLHHSIYLWFICFTWWSIDELENLHADRTTVCFEPWQKLRARSGARKTGLSPPPPVFLYWPFQGGTSVVVTYCSCCLCLYFGSSIMLVTHFVNFR